MTQSEALRQFNKWRRGDESVPQPDPKAIGELIDAVSDRLDALEEVVKAADRCYRMLLTEPDTKGALFKTENILREVLVGARTACVRSNLF